MRGPDLKGDKPGGYDARWFPEQLSRQLDPKDKAWKDIMVRQLGEHIAWHASRGKRSGPGTPR